MTQFPEEIQIRVENSATGEPVGDAVVFIQLFAKEKNNYRIGPLWSDRLGVIVVKSQQLRDSIARDRKLFLMDYKSSLEECGNLVEVDLVEPESIVRLIETRGDWRTACPELALSEEMVDRLRNSPNHNYHPLKRRMNVENEDVLVLRLVAN